MSKRIETKTKEDSKYIDVTTRSKMPFQFFIGPRGTGKTFSALRNEINNDCTGDKFIYLRNTQSEAEAATTTYGNAFKKINSVYGTDITGQFISKLGMGAFYKNDMADMLGYAFGLTTFAGKRSIDVSDASRVIFEEFIPEKHVAMRKNRGDAFLHFYETCNRNRELEGDDPLIVYFLANAISLSDDILVTFKITDDIENMIKYGERRRTIPERGIYIELVDVEISKEKENTALYKLGIDEFNDQALKADFANERLNLIKSAFNQRDYTPFLSYSKWCIYQSKVNGTYHIAMTNEQAKEHLIETETVLLRRLFRSTYQIEYGANRVTFDSYETKVAIEKALGFN